MLNRFSATTICNCVAIWQFALPQTDAQERSSVNRGEAAADPQDAGKIDHEDVVVVVPNMATAGKILREVGLAKAKEGIPQGDGEPRFDTENNRLYFRTTSPNVATMKKILARIESGGAAHDKATPEKTIQAKSPVRTSDQFFAIEIWLVQLQLPKGEEVDLAGSRAELLTILGGLEKETKAEVLNHVYLAVEERKSAETKLSESVAILDSFTMGGGVTRRETGGPGTPGDAATMRPMMGNVSRETLGNHIKVTAQSFDAKSALLDFSISKTFFGKPEGSPQLMPDAAGGAVRQPNTRLFEIESAIRAPLGNVITAASQMRGGEKPTEIRVLILVNPL